MNKTEFTIKTIELYLKFIDISISQIVTINRKEAYFPGGCNGPHLALESPVRNSAHVLYGLLVAYEVSGKSVYKATAERIFNWLFINCPYWKNGIYINRQKTKLDSCNGVIGNAWLIEALNKSKLHFKSNVSELDENLSSQNKYDNKINAWRRFDPINKRYGVDYTLDHQVWLASALVAYDFRANEIVNFLNACNQEAMDVRECGRINHLFRDRRSLKGIYLNYLYNGDSSEKTAFRSEIEIGYQVYTIFPFARLHRLYEGHPLFKSKKFLKALKYVDCNWAESALNNKYGVTYNSPGLELALIKSQFEDYIPLGWEEVYQLLEAHDAVMAGNSHNRMVMVDKLTLVARSYELGIFFE